MNLDSIVDIVNRKLIEKQNHPLNTTEMLVLRGIWEYKTYPQIAKEADYSPRYITSVVAPTLLGKISMLLGREVPKKICRPILESYLKEQEELDKKNVKYSLNISESEEPCYPSGSVPINSPFYVERSPIEEQVYAEIVKPGALVRIKAPREMGKTSFLLRAINYAKVQGYRTVSLNLEQVDEAILEDINKFLRCLCKNVTEQLGLESKLEEFWDEDIGSKVSCSLYFGNYLLKQIDSPLVLAFDELNQIFEHPQVARDFLPLLRSWYEEAKRSVVWQKLRLIVVHSTEIYVPLHIKQSPFNVGLPISLNSFSLEQVQELAKRYQLNWTDDSEAKQLIATVGGHPSLVHIAIYHLRYKDTMLSPLLQSAFTSNGIYFNHLQRHQVTLQEEPELGKALATVMAASEPIKLEPIVAYKLKSMGLIKLRENKATPSCQLYRQYFQQYFQNQQ